MVFLLFSVIDERYFTANLLLVKRDIEGDVFAESFCTTEQLISLKISMFIFTRVVTISS